ncbi:MAG: hypothetical protein P1T08_16235 [Acidimicrobiia bacterium]|nr:hypothetical protein [Acidimicrobiia bacterium]
MSNRSLPDRAVTPEWMSTALRIARMDKPWIEARRLLEIALRDEVESETGRSKTATLLAHCWLRPSKGAEPLVDWATEHADGDVRVWQLGVLIANYSFFGELCGEIGRRIGLSHEIDTSQLRTAMKGKWGDRNAVDVATQSSIRTLRSFGVIHGEEGDSASKPGDQIRVEPAVFPWLVHALLVGRNAMEVDLREALTAPELFMFDLPTGVGNGYPHLEHFTEGSGRVVVGIVKQRALPQTPTKQLALDVDNSKQLDLDC